MLEQLTTWKIGYVDEDAIKSTGIFDETIDVGVGSNIKYNNIRRDTVIFDKTFNINIGEKAIEFKINYNKIQCFNSKGEELKTDNIEHKFNNIPKGVTRIKAIYSVDDSYKNIIKYEFTLTDGFTKKEERAFTYLDNLNVNFNNIFLVYKTGNKINKKNTKYRWFDQSTHKWLAFLREDVSKAFDCVFEFDTYDKKVNCYSRKNLGRDKGLYLSYQNFIMDLNKEERIDEVVTRLYITGKENLQINSVNPLGTNYIEDFTYLIDKGNMSKSLENALNRYNVLAENIKVEWSRLKQEKDGEIQQSLWLQSVLTELNEKIKVQQSLKIGYMSRKEENNSFITQLISNCTNEINKLQNEINNNMNKLNQLKDKIKIIDDEIKRLNNNLNKSNARDNDGKIFTNDDLIELDESVFSARHQDDFYSTSYGLYENAKEILKRKNMLPIKFKCNVSNLTRLPRGWNNYIGLGDYATIEDDDIISNCIKDGFVRIIAYRYIPPIEGIRYEDILDIEFSNEEEQVDDLKAIGNIGKKTEQSKSMVDFWKSTWEESGRTNNFVSDMLDRGLDTAASIIRSRASVNQVEINETGIWCIDRTDGSDNKQIYMGAGMISISDDGWKTAKLAIDSNGIIAKRLVGEQIFGRNLIASSELGTFKIDGDGMTIYDEFKRVRVQLGVYDVNGSKKAGLIMYNKDGDKVLISEDGIAQVDSQSSVDNLDPDHPMYFPVYIPSNIREIREAKLFLHMEKYRAYFQGGASGGGTTKSTTWGGGGTESSAWGGDGMKTSEGGGGGTSAGGGGGTSSGGGGGTSASGGSTSSSNANRTSTNVFEGKFLIEKASTLEIKPPSGSDGSQSPVAGVRQHQHALKIDINPHEHNMEHIHYIGNHTHGLPAHTHGLPTHTHGLPTHTHNIIFPSHRHNVTFPQHTHDITLEPHVHSPIYKIYESSYPSNVRIVINGQTIRSGINGDIQLDIGQYLQRDRLNIIEIFSNSNGRINALLSMNTFASF